MVAHAGMRIGVTLCEDIWAHPMISTRRLYNGLDPVKQLAAQNCDLMVNLSASPWNHGKSGVRQTLVTDAAKALGCPVAYVNAVGGNDELIFDVAARSSATAKAACWRGWSRLPRISSSSTPIPAPPPKTPCLAPTFEQPEMADIHAAVLALGLRDYARQERVPDRPGGPFRRHRLGGCRRDCGDGLWPRKRDRRLPPLPDLLPTLEGRCAPLGPEPRHALRDHRNRRPGGHLREGARPPLRGPPAGCRRRRTS